MKKVNYPIESKHVDTLMKRFIYLNQLRVGVITVFFAIAAALWRSFVETPNLLWLIASLLLGFLVYVFDLRCRARASRVAQGIRARVLGLSKYKVRSKLLYNELFNEDTIFSAIVMLINAAFSFPIIFALFTLAGRQYMFSNWIGAIVAFIIFVFELMIYTIVWPKLAATMMDEWPDDDLIEQG